MIDSALQYAARGMRVFPVQPEAKAPLGQLVPQGVKDATTDEDQIRQWWEAEPDANIGLATGEVFVIDLDVKGDLNGATSWNRLCRENGGAPTTTTVSTPSGGTHLYFRAAGPENISNSVADLAEGVDVRGHGGYVLVPPSTLLNGGYEWALEEEIAQAPGWLVERVSGTDDKGEVGDIEEAAEEIPKGKRNDKLTSLGGYVRRKGMEEGEVFSFLKGVNQARCSPSLPTEEVRSIAESVCRYDPSDALSVTAGGTGTPAEYKEIARRLLAVLYEHPSHGPIIQASLPAPDRFPAPYGMILSEMVDHGLPSGDLDRARVDAALKDAAAFREVRVPDFDTSRFDGRGHSQLMVWADSLANQSGNAEMAKDLRRLADEIETTDDHPQQSIAKVIGRVQEHAEPTSTQMTSMKDAAKEALATVARWKQGETVDRMPTWPSVDDKLGGGLVEGQMTVFAGFTSGFKTASLVDLAKRVALRNEERDLCIPLFSAEMTAEELTHRMAANMSNVSAATLRPDRNRNVTATEGQYSRYEDAIEQLSHLNIEVDEHPNPSYERMLSHCLQIDAQQEIAFVGFDYIEKMDENEDTEELRVSRAAQDLKALAKKLDVPVVVLSQYSRQKSAHTQLPRNYYLRYSGKIEHEAQTIIHWWYPKYFVDRGMDPGAVAKYDPQDEHAIYAVCGKNRDGEVQNAKLHVNESTGRFLDRYDEDKPTANLLEPTNEKPF